ncbi:hypothetical protein PsorP6_005561 [Peronosclerospora sorghi]|uniref:Uncharacterized protein n=1 Tax=Peronosclerospora sorghi TaxID=230839 RepID=A0ACC0W5X4_9STRA|nr:hypothetical protein PsorP6_005561 [Peronosclerospora sorghi]
MDVDRSVAITSSTAVTDATASLKKGPTYTSHTSSTLHKFPVESNGYRVAKSGGKGTERAIGAHKDRFKIKATITGDKEDVGFAVRIYSLDNVPRRCVVEIQRTSGECLKFREAYKKLGKLLCDLICDKSNELETAEATKL